MKSLKMFIAAALLFSAAVSARAWELTPEARNAYDALCSAEKFRLEGWLHNLPQSGDAANFQELAKGTFLWSQKRPRGTLETLLALFAHADQDKSLDSVELILGTQKGQVLLWIRQENESCA